MRAVYNFEVENDPTYYVSDNEILVHNKCRVDDVQKIPEGLRTISNQI